MCSKNITETVTSLPYTHMQIVRWIMSSQFTQSIICMIKDIINTLSLVVIHDANWWDYKFVTRAFKDNNMNNVKTHKIDMK